MLPAVGQRSWCGLENMGAPSSTGDIPEKEKHEKEWDHSLTVDECRKNLVQSLADDCFPLAGAG